MMEVVELRPNNVFILGKKKISIEGTNDRVKEQRYGYIPVSRLKSSLIPSIPNLINATTRLHFDYDDDKHNDDQISYSKGDDNNNDDNTSSDDSLKHELNALDLGTAQLQRVITQMNELMVKSSKDNFYFNKDAPAAAGLNYYTPYLRGSGLLPKKSESVEHILLEKMKLEEAAKKKATSNSEKDKK